MNPILIVAYPEKIAAEEAWLDTQINYFQDVYDHFKAIDIAVTTTEISHIINRVSNGNQSHGDSIRDFVTSKMVEKTGAPTLNGVPIKQEKIKDMIHIPDVHHIQTWIHNKKIVYHHGFEHHLQPELFEIINGVVARKETTSPDIIAKHSLYTKNDKGIQTFNLIMEWKSIVDAFNQRTKALNIDLNVPYTGLYSYNGVLRPTVEVIRKNEAGYPGNYIAE